ncbi:uncharacterized protein [Palaemon carinicauda]|uniref:uncharacterized protein n=1 Tax=Palaemon carinicauda TaxID=392227 RepID=UPI0035B596D5
MKPRWMSEMANELSHLRISDLVIPGIYSGRWRNNQCHRESPYTDVNPSKKDFIWHQLVFGTRYLQVNISYRPETKCKFHVSVGLSCDIPLQSFIYDIVKFMSQTDEIVIIDILQLPSEFADYPEQRQDLLSLLETNFKGWMATDVLSPNQTFGELQQRGSRLIVMYPSSERSTSAHLWESIYHLWSKITNEEDLIHLLYDCIPQQRGRSLWALTLEFSMEKLLQWGGWSGTLAIENSEVESTFSREWWNMVNIIAVDSLLSSDIVEVAIEANKKKATWTAEIKQTKVLARRRWLAKGYKRRHLVRVVARTSKIICRKQLLLSTFKILKYPV